MVAIRDYIAINKALVPYRFNILLADEWFKLYVNYNETADLFTVTVYKNDQLVCTEPLILGMPLFQDIYQPGRFPAITLVPYGPEELKITFNNMNETVFLTIDNEGDSDG